MKFIIIFGPQAVGKMTVGYELEKITELKLLHNHMTIELLYPLFGFGPETWRLSDHFRQEIFKAVAESTMQGLIFTYVWAFDQKDDWEFVNKICNIFETNSADIYFVQLEADLEQRLERNKSAHRLEHKPTKRNINYSEQELLKTMEQYRLNSYEGEITRKNYIRINNTDLKPDEVAKIIRDKFQL